MKRMDRHPVDGHAEVAGRLLVLSAGLDPVAEPCPRQEERSERADQRGTTASTCGSRRAAVRPSIALNSGGMATVIGKPPVSEMSTPRQISIVPRVTTKEWILNLTTISAVDRAEHGADGDRRRRPP